ncbi:MAG: IclR family transcriptional regulator [Rhodococcus sp. (in: high G+C Gram-positive bacteria)]
MARLTPALVRTFDILEMFLDVDDRGLTATDIVDETHLPRTTVHELLVTMVARKYLRRDDDTGRYHLGISVFQLGNSFADRLDLLTVGRRVTQRVAARCDETVNFGILDGESIIYLCKVESTKAVRTISRAGGRLPASCTAIGKAMLAFLPEPALTAMANQVEFPAITPRSITDPAELIDQLARVREVGVAYEAGESNPDVSCVAAPVRDHRGDVVAALSISVPDMRWTLRSEDEWASIVLDGARELSRELGSSH